MGAWGESPTDNDTAADLAYKLKEYPVYHVILLGLDSEDPHEQRLGAWLIVQLGDNYVFDIDKRDPYTKLAIEKIEALLVNEEWIASWREPAKILTSLRKQLADLKLI